jgi:fumarylpyruvate hydrolase
MTTMKKSVLATGIKYAFPPPSVPAVPVWKSELWFPVHRIYCVGRNYADHAIEMGGDPSREPPFFFSKPADAVVVAAACSSPESTSAGAPSPKQPRCRAIKYPLATTNVHPEVELVVAIGQGGVDIPQEDAMRHVFGFAVGIDLTRRDLQGVAKERSRPWDCAKAFDASAPMGEIMEKRHLGVTDKDIVLGKRSIWLDVDGVRQQTGTLAQMTWSISEVIAILSTQFYLKPGDLIFTGTPSGVGPVEKGQIVTAGVDEIGRLQFVLE